MDDLQNNNSAIVEQPKIDVLRQESTKILNKLVDETDASKSENLIYLFNVNNNKRTVARVNKLNDLLDTITDQAIVRFTTKPDNISNQELIQSLKVVQDMVERSQNQVNGVNQKPLIQINQQTNSVNVGTPEQLSRESRDRIKAAVSGILTGLGLNNAMMKPEAEEIIELENQEPGVDENGNN